MSVENNNNDCIPGQFKCTCNKQKKKRGRPLGVSKFTPDEAKRRLHYNNSKSTVKNIDKLNMTKSEMESMLAMLQSSEMKLIEKILNAGNDEKKDE